jgi:PIN domain nuclease of toxin-antitoxin system
VKVLLDTSVLLWWLGDTSRIAPALLDDMMDDDSVILFSQVSLLEIQIKVGLGKLRLDFAVERIPGLADGSGLTGLPLSNAAIFTLPKLPALHRDPFDRLLICEAIQEGVPLVTTDEVIQRYPVKTLSPV